MDPPLAFSQKARFSGVRPPPGGEYTQPRSGGMALGLSPALIGPRAAWRPVRSLKGEAGSLK